MTIHLPSSQSVAAAFLFLASFGLWQSSHAHRNGIELRYGDRCIFDRQAYCRYTGEGDDDDQLSVVGLTRPEYYHKRTTYLCSCLLAIGASVWGDRRRCPAFPAGA